MRRKIGQIEEPALLHESVIQLYDKPTQRYEQYKILSRQMIVTLSNCHLLELLKQVIQEAVTVKIQCRLQLVYASMHQLHKFFTFEDVYYDNDHIYYA